MTRLLLLPASLATACLIAALYGALHNQISYTVSPEYFHAFKFKQFAIGSDFQNRIGAAIVGIKASWWMGIIIGLPIFLIGLFVRDNTKFVREFARATIAVVIVTGLSGLFALAASFVLISADSLPHWALESPLADPAAFARAGTMHNFSYLGGLLGLLTGAVMMARASIRSRRN